MTRLKQVVSSLLVCAMVTSIAPTVAFAANDDNIVTYTVEGGNIYFDTSTGTVTDSDVSITGATIPAQINGTNVTSIEDGAFSDCSALTSITLPDGLESIGDEAFSGTSLESIDIPTSVTSIGDGAFLLCGKLNNVVIPEGITSIGHDTFEFCESLDTITIPDTVTSIGDMAFYSCSKLNNITIPDRITSIGQQAFDRCVGLTTIDIPSGLTDIDWSVFAGSTSLNSINVAADNPSYCSVDGVLFSKDQTTLVQYPAGKEDESYQIPSSVTRAGNDAFRGSKNLKTVYIPTSFKALGQDLYDTMFEDCTNLTTITVEDANTDYSSVDGVLFNKDKTILVEYPDGRGVSTYKIPSSVKSIEDAAFEGCSNLTQITIPNGVTKIGHSAFHGCKKLESIAIPASVTEFSSSDQFLFDECDNLQNIDVSAENPNYSSEDGVLFNKDKTTLIKYPVGKVADTYIVPDGVTSVGLFAFAYNQNLTTLTIPNSVTSIGQGAFSECDNLNSITLSDSLTAISESAFGWDSSLKNLTIPNSVTSIHRYAFSDCYGLNSLIIPENVTSIGQGALQDCYGLKNIVIPNGITSIENDVFKGCTGLNSVVIPSSVTSVGYKAFQDCNSLTDVYFGGSEEQWNAISIDRRNRFLTNATIHYKSTGPVDEKKNIQNTEVTGVQESYTYTGGAITPEVVVKDGSSTLVAGADYEVSYDNNENHGTATITIAGKGRYSGKKIVTFEITKAVLTITAKDKTITYGDVPANDGVTITGLVNGDTESIVTGLEYSYDYEQYGNVGTYAITPKAAVADNYEIKLVAGKLKVEPKTVGLTWNDGNLYYNGKAKNVSAEATGTVNGDEVKVTVVGGNKTEIGAYTAAATGLTGAKAANYALPTDTAHSYSIVSALNKLRVEPNTITATVEGLTIKLVGYATGEITISADDAVVEGDKLTVHGVEYTIDKSGVKEIPAEVEIETPTSNVKKAEGATIDDSVVSEINSAETKGEGLNEAAADTIAVADKTITAEDKANAVTKVKVQTVLDIRPKSYANGELTMNIEPKIKYIYVKADNAVVRSTEPEKLDNSSIKAPITINVKLPSGFEPNFAKHGNEMIPVTVSNGVATWQQSSFSDVTLVSDKRAAVITFQFADGHTQTIRYTAANIGDKLPTDSKNSSTFKGWKIGDTIYTTLTDEALTALNGTKTLTAEFTANSGSNGGGSSSGGSSGGGAAATDSYSITVKNVQNGTVTVSHKTAAKNTTVTITATPDKGYPLSSVKVLDQNNKEVKLNQTNGKYTFTMPASKVTIQVVFQKETTTEKPTSTSFVDVPAGSFYENAVKWAVEKNITTGTSDTTFTPDGICTRAQAVAFLWRAAGSPEPKSTTMTFSDVQVGSYYEKAVLWAVENGITKGTSQTAFSPNATCSRSQIVTFLWRSQQSPTVGTSNPFTDVAATAYYANAVLWAVEKNVTAGTSSTTFSPNADCTRAQIVTFLYRTYTNK